MSENFIAVVDSDLYFKAVIIIMNFSLDVRERLLSGVNHICIMKLKTYKCLKLKALWSISNSMV